MINKGVVLWCVVVCCGVVCCVGVSFQAVESKIAAMGASNIRIVKRAAALSTELEKVKIDLASCQGSIQEAEASLESFYQQLIYADRIDVVTFGADGAPRRLVFDCDGRGKQ